MRILFIIHSYPPLTKGGAELYTSWVIDELKREHEISLFGPMQSKKNEIKISDVKMFFFKTRYSVSAYDRYPVCHYGSIKDKRTEILFIRTIKECNPDVIHFQHIAKMPFSLIRIAKQQKIPIVVTLHDFWYLCPRIHFYNGCNENCESSNHGTRCITCLRKITDIKQIIKKRMEKFCFLRRPNVNFFKYRYQYAVASLNMADAIIAPSKFVRERYIEEGVDADKIEILPFGIMPVTRSKLPRDQINLGYIGTIKPHKGCQDLLEAFRLLRSNRAMLHIFGSGDLKWLKNFLNPAKKDLVVFHGDFDHAQKNDVYKMIDIIIIPSRCYETYSFVAHEAIASGIPVIAPRHSVFCEIIEDGKNGFLFEPFNVNSLASKIEHAISTYNNWGVINKCFEPLVSEQTAYLVKIYKRLLRLPEDD
ncbi:MAG: glycosyltransferase [Bacteroidales bacterium]